MVIGIDFDGTCVTHEFPSIGQSIGAERVLRRLIDAGHQLVLFTMRSDSKNVKSNSPDIVGIEGDYLTAAVEWFRERKIPLYGINENPTQKLWTESPKAHCDLYIDDAGLGIPLIKPAGGLPFVWWEKVEIMLETIGVLPETPSEQ